MSMSMMHIARKKGTMFIDDHDIIMLPVPNASWDSVIANTDRQMPLLLHYMIILTTFY